MTHTCHVYETGRPTPGTVALTSAASTARTTGGFLWIDLDEPTPEELAVVGAQLQVPVALVEDALAAHPRPRLRLHEHVVSVVLRPVQDADAVGPAAQVAVLLGARFAVTVHHGGAAVVRRTRDALDRDRSARASGPVVVLLGVTEAVAAGYEDAIDGITGDVDDVESTVFGPGEDDHAEAIYRLTRKVAELRRAVVPLARKLERLATSDVPLLQDAPDRSFRDILDQVLRTAENVEGFDRLLGVVLQANVARVSASRSRIALRQSDDTRRISAWAAIALVPTVVTGVYGMNFANMPELQWQWGYLLVLLFIASFCVVLHWRFRHNGWL